VDVVLPTSWDCITIPSGASRHLPTAWGGLHHHHHPLRRCAPPPHCVGRTTSPPSPPPALRATSPLRGEDYITTITPSGAARHLPTSWGGLRP